MYNISILNSIPSQENFWLEIAKMIIPPLITGVIALIPYFAELKNSKGKILMNEKLNNLKLLKTSILDYYAIVVAYYYSSEEKTQVEVNKLCDYINNKRFLFNQNFDNCSSYFSDENKQYIKNFADKFLEADINTRNNLDKNINKNKQYIMYEDVSFSTNKNMYEKVLEIIDKTINNIK